MHTSKSQPKRCDSRRHMVEVRMAIDLREPIEVWEPRCRGDWRDFGIFLICRRDGADVIMLTPRSMGAHPLQVYERLLYDNHPISRPDAGGLFSLTEFDFTVPPNHLDLVPEFFRRVFASPQIGPSHWFNRYRSAHILIRSEPSEWGTIDDVLHGPDIFPNAG